MVRFALLATGMFVLVSAVLPRDKVTNSSAPGPMIGHMVYFKLKESGAENKQKLVAACKKYLSDHEGTVFFSAGEMEIPSSGM